MYVAYGSLLFNGAVYGTEGALGPGAVYGTEGQLATVSRHSGAVYRDQTEGALCLVACRKPGPCLRPALPLRCVPSNPSSSWSPGAPGATGALRIGGFQSLGA